MQRELITVPVGGTLLEAAEALARGDIHSVPVVDDDHGLAGIVTSTDLIRFLLNHLDLDVSDHDGVVDELDEPHPADV
jgi:CBS domain-containing protein